MTGVADITVKREDPIYLNFTSIDKKEDVWGNGLPTTVDIRAVVAMEPRENRYHSFRSPQQYTVLHLNTGAVIEVLSSVENVRHFMRQAYERAGYDPTIIP